MNIDPAKIAASKARAEKPSRKASFRRGGVRDAVEFRRIANLPRRAPEHASAEDCEKLSALLRKHGGTMTLNPVQAAVLAELNLRNGCVGSICAGGGKTLITYLAALVMGVERALVLVPSGLVEKTHRDYEALSKMWDVDHAPHVLGYTRLSLEQSANVLRDLRPQIIIADEAQKLKNASTAVTRRVKRYLAENPETIFLPFSGTLTSSALKDCAHLYDWALGILSPLPRRRQDVVEWGLAVDVDVPAGTLRYGAGALAQLYDEDEARLAATHEIGAVRSAVRRRLIETPGVIATHESFVGASLTVNVIPLMADRPEVDAAIEKINERWETPDGHPISDAASKWRHTIEIGAGFFYVWDPRPPREWLEARSAWSRTCRHILGHNQRELDSELQVYNAIRRERDAGGSWIKNEPTSNGLPVSDRNIDETLARWENVRESFDPNTEPRWLDNAVIDFVREWAANGVGIIWCGHVALAERIEEELGYTYYGQMGLDGKGRAIESADPKHGSIVASIASSGTGRNLQAWSRSLVIPSIFNGEKAEQLFARTHREGQRADEVVYDILITNARAYASYQKARTEARYIQDVSGQQQRLLFADIVDDVPRLTEKSEQARWAE